MKLISLRHWKKHHSPYIQYNDMIRDSFIIEYSNVLLTGRNIHYPNCLLYTKDSLINPYDERVMSLQKDSFYDNDEWNEFSVPMAETIDTRPSFFFVYNVDNYYHFVYDSLPFLASYFKLKEVYPSIQLLIQTSHPSKNTISPFVDEFLKAIGISSYSFAKSNTTYRQLFVASSLTHGQQSNEPPSDLARSIWNKYCYTEKSTPKRFYISRRSWVHGNTTNIGTNYTMRRKCVNEDDVVMMLKKYDIQEVFTELLTTDEKIAYFRNAELVVGVVGGGMCNLLFSNPSTKALCITTPHFLSINKRFEYSMNAAKLYLSECTEHSMKNLKFQYYSRVKISNKESIYYNKVGEVEAHDGIHYTVRLSSNDIAGFSQDFLLEEAKFLESELIAIDQGLNSPYVCKLEILESDLKLLEKTS